MYITDLSGEYEVILGDGTKHSAVLPGSLDENKIGYPDKPGNQWHPAEGLGEADERSSELIADDIIKTRLTRYYTYEGAATFIKNFKYEPKTGKRYFLDIERARKITSCKINGCEAGVALKGTLSTPYSFELTDYVKEDNILEITSDNTYPGWPKEAILFSSAATDETQTNWNGLLGEIKLREEEADYVSMVRVYPRLDSVKVVVSVDVASEELEGEIVVKSEVIDYGQSSEKACDYVIKDNVICKRVKLSKGVWEVVFENITLKANVKHWDEYEGNLYELTAGIVDAGQKTVSFGVREFSGKTGYLINNGHRIFLRSESNCCVFPETGHAPLTYDEWLSVLEVYKSYGINCMRFHSHCPPEAAFAAADSLGMFVQPELSHWDPNNAFESEESEEYYELELRQILYCYANHPSFVMLTLGNELHSKKLTFSAMSKLLGIAKALDDTRLYAEGSNAYYGEQGAFAESDFYTSFAYYGKDLRGTNCNMVGHINDKYPSAKENYDDTLVEIRKTYDKPVFSFEVGQFEVLPDFDELSEYKGVTRPDNIKSIRDAVEKEGFLEDWKKRVEVTGEMALLAYREEIESAMRTKEMSGISLLGLQDFTGQGTALVGMLNPHLCPKPYDFARPERFKKFFTSVLPLVRLDKYTYSAGETLKAEVVLANYGREDVREEAWYELWDGDVLYKEGALSVAAGRGGWHCYPCGELTSAGFINVEFDDIDNAKRLTLKVAVGRYTNEYTIFVYDTDEMIVPENVCVTKSAEEAKKLLLEGKQVFLEPDFEEASDGGLGAIIDEGEKIGSIKTCFTTDFWSVGTFPSQEGYMGCLIDEKHPIYKSFPTTFYPEWQWWIITKARAMVLPESVEPLLEVLDCYARLRKMAFIFEKRVGEGKLLVSSLGLLDKQEYPEARALLKGILDYVASEGFNPN